MLLCYKTSTSKEQIQKGFKAILSTFSLSNKIFFKSLRVHFNVTKRIIFFQSQFSRKYSKHFLRLKPLLIPNSTWLRCLYPPNPIMMCCSLTSNKQQVSTLAWDFFRENCWSIIWKSLCLTRFADVAVSVANIGILNSIVRHWRCSNVDFIQFDLNSVDISGVFYRSDFTWNQFLGF